MRIKVAGGSLVEKINENLENVTKVIFEIYLFPLQNEVCR